MEHEEIYYRKVVVRKFGGADVLETIETTLCAPPPGHARVKVLAIGVGFTDLAARAGEYLLQRKVPFTPGYELVGEVVDSRGCDSDVPGPGTRVAVALPKMGAYSEYVVVPAWLLVPVPDGLDSTTAATIPLDYLTALSLLERHGHVQEGASVLIQGASGGVGDALSQLGRLKRLKMYGTASSEDRLARNGVRFIDYRNEDFAAVVRRWEPGGVQAVFDHIGGTNLRKGYRLLAPGGVLVSYAFMGRPGRIFADTLGGGAALQLRGLLPGKRTALCMVPREIRSDHRWYRDNLRRLLDMTHKGDIRTEIGAVAALTDVADVHRALERRALTGKAVLTT